ncbi:MAG TPA: hotdog fold thioesterase, partial [Actinomycetota bacterium]|nr:hotdog fold thioesterase [Actinomycetota bacterium]
LIARGRLIQSGSKVGLSEVLVEDGMGRLLAHGSSRCFILPPMSPPPDTPSIQKTPPQVFESPDPYLREIETKPLPAEIRTAESGLDITLAHIEGRLESAPWATLFGSRPVEAAEGSATLEVDVTGWHTSGLGTMYGGAIALFADAAMMTSVYTTLPPDTATTTLDIKVHFLRPVMPGTKLRATSTVVHRGKTMAVCHCQLTNSEQKIVAVAQGSTLIAPGRVTDRDHPLVPADEAEVS